MVVTLPRDTQLGYLHSVLSVTVSGCGAPGESDRSRGFTMTTAIYAVEGLKCEYGMAKVLENVRSLSGVTRVAMDLIRGGQSPLMVRSRTKLVAEAVRSAVENAGFGLLAPRGSGVGGRRDSSPPWTAIPTQTYLHSSSRRTPTP